MRNSVVTKATGCGCWVVIIVQYAGNAFFIPLYIKLWPIFALSVATDV